MKKIFILGISVSALLLSNCSNEEIIEKAPAGNTVVTAVMESGNDARSNVDDKGFFTWTKGDDIAVYTTTDDGNKWSQFSLQGQGGTATGSFSGTLVGTNAKTSKCAVYPYHEGKHSLTGRALTFHLPDAYTYQEGNTNAPMLALIAKDGDANFDFKHLGGVIRFKINNVPAQTTQLVFTTSHQITGDFTVTDIQAADAQISTPGTSASGNNAVTIHMEASDVPANKVFYIPMPVGTYTQMTLEFKDKNGSLLNKSETKKSNAIERRTLLLMPTLTCADAEGSIIASASNVGDLNNLLSSAESADKLGSVTLSGDGVKDISDAITIPTTYTSGDGGTPKALNLTFDDVPTASNADAAIEIKDENSGSTTAGQSNAKVEVSIPEIAREEAAPSFDITLPTATVTISATGETATYNKVTASTATNTLIVGKGVTVKELIIKGGNVAVYGVVEKLSLAEGNTTATTVTSYGAGNIQEVTDKSYLSFKSEWDGVSSVQPANNKIYTAAQLASYQSQTTSQETTADGLAVTMPAGAELYCDVDLKGYDWKGIVLASDQIFDGKGKTISNLSMTQPVLYETGELTRPACIGFFAAAYSGSTIKNIKLDKVQVGTNSANVECKWVGSLVGYSLAGTYTDCSADNVEFHCSTHAVMSYRVGGLIGFIASGNPTLTNCEVNKASIVANFSYGGLVGSIMANETTLTGCKTTEISLPLGYCDDDDCGYVSKFIGDADMNGGSRKITISNCTSVSLDAAEKEALHFYKITKQEGNKILTYADGNQYVGKVAKTTLTLIVAGQTLTNGEGYNTYTEGTHTDGNAPQYDNTGGITEWDK